MFLSYILFFLIYLKLYAASNVGSYSFANEDGASLKIYRTVKDTFDIQNPIHVHAVHYKTVLGAHMNHTYVSVRYSSKDLIFFLKPEFKHYEERETLNSTTATGYFNTTEGTTNLSFILTVEDTNNHDPVFSSPTYNYNISLPLSANVDLEGDQPIVAEDIDISTTNIDFIIEYNEYFDIVRRGSAGPKKYKASLITKKKIVEMKNNLTLTIYAEDDGKPTRKSTAKVTILLVPEYQLKFSKDVYQANYSIDNSLHFNEAVELSKGYNIYQTTIVLTGDYSEHFSVSLQPNGYVLMSVIKPIANYEKSKHYLLLTLKATTLDTKQSTKATVIINLPELTEPECTGDNFKCKNGNCLKKDAICDGKTDCPDGEDEQNCSYHIAYACENELLMITCKENELIQVLYGNYGRTEPHICKWVEAANCYSTNTTDILKTTCNLKQDCRIGATNSIFGDSCQGRAKYLEVRYRCLIIPDWKNRCIAEVRENRTTSSSQLQHHFHWDNQSW